MAYLPFHPDPKKPDFIVPDNACDAHCHVFGPAAVFPFAPESKYTPVDAPKEKLFELHKHLGFTRSVIVQASCHGTDNRAMIDALEASDGLYRGVAVVGPDVTAAQVKAMDEAGVRGIRFNFVKRLVDAKPREYYIHAAKLIAAFGWHIVVYFESEELVDIEDLLLELPIPLVIDHMGRPDVAKGLDHPDYQRIKNLVAQRDDCWIKVGCLERLTKIGPPYDDAVPFGRDLVETFPDKVLWGTDWPHPNMESHIPDDGQLVDMIPRIATTEELQRKLLVDNSMRLYWPESG